MFDLTTMRRQKEKLFERFKETIDFIITDDLHQYGKNYALTLSFLNEFTSEIGIGEKVKFKRFVEHAESIIRNETSGWNRLLQTAKVENKE